jgi:uncharacterized protein with HEPN domain
MARSSAILLRASLAELERACTHLSFSRDRVSGLGGDLREWTEEELERAEAFTSRFGRVVDLLTNKVLRALFLYELEPVGTALDRVNLAEKRGFVDRADRLTELKEQRNVIAHDYAGSELARVLAFGREHAEELHATCRRVAVYAERRLAAEEGDKEPVIQPKRQEPQ